MDERLLSRGEASEQVGVAVAGQQQDLKEHHAGGPDGRAPAEPRQNEPRDDRLNLKEKERTDEDRDAEERQRSWFIGIHFFPVRRFLIPALRATLTLNSKRQL